MPGCGGPGAVFGQSWLRDLFMAGLPNTFLARRVGAGLGVPNNSSSWGGLATCLL